MKEALRLFTALGPGDVVGARKTKLAGKPVNETSIAFSEQLFSYCRLREIKTLAISSNDRKDELVDGNITIENRPKLLRYRGGLQFHISLVLYGLYLMIRARRFRADVAIIDSSTTHYFVLFLFRAAGIPVAVNLHNVLWPAGFPPTRFVPRIIRTLNRLFFRHGAAGAIGVSPECERQISAESRGRISFFQYRCQFNLNGFKKAQPYQTGAFRIIFVGRAERNKGVLDLVQMAAELKARARIKVVFDICGDGPALPELIKVIEQKALHDLVIVHGRLERDALLGIYANSHLAIVPTRSNFNEGMPQVCAEAVLSTLPVITSRVANAFDVIGAATLRAETDDIESYVNAIISLIDSPDLYERLRSNCHSLSHQFSNRGQSYPAAVDRLLGAVLGRPLLTQYDHLFLEQKGTHTTKTA